jgi:hypothetical protein
VAEIIWGTLGAIAAVGFPLAFRAMCRRVALDALDRDFDAVDWQTDPPALPQGTRLPSGVLGEVPSLRSYVQNMMGKGPANEEHDRQLQSR